MEKNPCASTFGMNFDSSCKPKPSNYFNILKNTGSVVFFVRLRLFELQFLHGFDKGLGLMPHWSASGQSRRQRQGLKELFKHAWQSSPSSIAVANEVL